jgi:carbon monoxide dehydrogenase subunit G
MFIVSAEFREKIEVKASLEKVREFLFDLQNFAELMPNVESIRTDAKGITRWTISVDIPVVGKVRESFPVELEETPDDEIEWRPAAGEKENLLRYMAFLMEKGAETSIIQISQKVEIRRNKAKDLHPLASVAGENLISKEMNKRVAEMIKEFLQKARHKLER